MLGLTAETYERSQLRVTVSERSSPGAGNEFLLHFESSVQCADERLAEVEAIEDA